MWIVPFRFPLTLFHGLTERLVFIISMLAQSVPGQWSNWQ
jgi:hypothetical protein